MNNIALLPVWYISIFVFIFGISMGSFLNVAILRGLKGEDIVFGRSKCPKCDNQLAWFMNIPLVSYIFLKGKCAFCKTKISFQYPLVEFICGICFLFSYLSFGLTLKTLFICLFLSVFIALAATDFIETVIIDYHAYILCVLGLLYSFLNLGDVGILQSFLGAIGGFLVFELLARFGNLIANHRMFGEGDSLIALGLGAIFGFKNLLIIIALSILFQVLSCIPLLMINALKEKKNDLVLSYLITFLGIILVFCINYFNLIRNSQVHFFVSLICVVFLIYALKVILSEIKSKKQLNNETIENNFIMLPFGPALIFASTLCIFYLPLIKKTILKFLF